jgi:hypothetical protein
MGYIANRPDPQAASELARELRDLEESRLRLADDLDHLGRLLDNLGKILSKNLRIYGLTMGTVCVTTPSFLLPPRDSTC